MNVKNVQRVILVRGNIWNYFTAINAGLHYVETVTERRMTDGRKTERKMTERKMTERGMTEGRKWPLVQWLKVDNDWRQNTTTEGGMIEGRKDLTEKMTEGRWYWR
jgi:hypothetical protein